MNKDGVLEELCCYLGPKKDKNTKKIWWSSEHPVATGRQRKSDTISGGISCLAPNSRANNIENIEDTFHLYFENDIMDKIVDCTNIRINETIARLQRNDNFNQSSKHIWVKKRQSWNWCAVWIDVLQRNTWSKSSYDYNVIMSKNRFRFFKGHIFFRQPIRKNTAVGNR